MSFNTFGHSFRVTTFGESHGPAIGCVVDGCPPRIALSESDIQPYLDRRRPGQSRFTTPVSYTHLDVYKRQPVAPIGSNVRSGDAQQTRPSRFSNIHSAFIWLNAD